MVNPDSPGGCGCCCKTLHPEESSFFRSPLSQPLYLAMQIYKSHEYPNPRAFLYLLEK